MPVLSAGRYLVQFFGSPSWSNNGYSEAIDVEISATTAPIDLTISTPNQALSGNSWSFVPTLTGRNEMGSTVEVSYKFPGMVEDEQAAIQYHSFWSDSESIFNTGGQYTLTTADVGKSLSVFTVASASGQRSAVLQPLQLSFCLPIASNPTTTLTPAPTVTVVPSVSGTAQVGKTLTTTTGSWSPTPDTVSMQWLRDGLPVAGENSSSYALTEADLGKSISVTLTAIKAGHFPGTIQVAPTAPVAAVTPPVITPPVVTPPKPAPAEPTPVKVKATVKGKATLRTAKFKKKAKVTVKYLGNATTIAATAKAKTIRIRK